MNHATTNNTVHLLTNNRFKDGSNIDYHVKTIKKCINTKNYDFSILYDNNVSKGNVIKSGNIYSFIKKFPSHISNHENRILTWTRDQFKSYNEAARVILHNERIAKNTKFVKGERFISYSSNNKKFVYIGDEGIVTHVGTTATKNEYISSLYNVDIYSRRYELTLDNGVIASVDSLDKQSMQQYENLKQSLYKSAINSKKYERRKLWGRYWKLYNLFHKIEPAYAQTIHSSQGSTYKSIIVDAHNISNCDDLETRYRLYYVAFSRAKHLLMINI
jgi:hypothetical protein